MSIRGNIVGGVVGVLVVCTCHRLSGFISQIPAHRTRLLFVAIMGVALDAVAKVELWSASAERLAGGDRAAEAVTSAELAKTDADATAEAGADRQQRRPLLAEAEPRDEEAAPAGRTIRRRRVGAKTRSAAAADGLSRDRTMPEDRRQANDDGGLTLMRGRGVGKGRGVGRE